jgi:hypothetical protein
MTAAHIHRRRWLLRTAGALVALFFLRTDVRAERWVWKAETVDRAGIFMSLRADTLGNLHLAYASDEEGVKYAFRPVGTSRWFTLVVDPKPGLVGLAVDQQGNPHICHSKTGELFYSHWDGKQWNTQQIAPGSGNISFTCSVAVGPGGTPQLAWYQYGSSTQPFYLHIKYAALRDGAWLARTIDFDGETGKWNSLLVDNQGVPHVTYSSFQRGELKYASWDGKTWMVQAVDSRGRNPGDQLNRGFGNSLVLDAQGRAHISYFDDASLKYAMQAEKGWKLQTVDAVPMAEDWAAYRSSIALDSHGYPHIAYESSGAVKHAYWDGKRWHIQVISPSGSDVHRYSSMAMDGQGTVFIAYRDSADGSVKIAVGERTPDEQVNAVTKEPH